MKHPLFGILVLFLTGCSQPQPPVATSQSGLLPEIVPDYTGVTIPATLAPPAFALKEEENACVVFRSGNYSFCLFAPNGRFSIPEKKWSKLLADASGSSVEVTILVEKQGEWVADQPFHIQVSADPIDPYIAYRLIAPGYQLWGEMGIYQRELGSYRQTAILENRQTDGSCMNCHSFCQQDPNRMLFHVRAKHGCTVLIKDGEVVTLDTKTDRTISALVYPSWHPSGRFVAFSVNNTSQSTHPAHRTDVYDKASDVVVYDVERQEIVTTAHLFSPKSFETFPSFSPDGNQLYFCTAQARPVPNRLPDLRYSLCRIAFDPENRAFGQAIDTLYRAEDEGKSILFPRVSPDGRFLLCTTTSYGTFPIWHKDADLCMFDLETGKQIPADEVNSSDTESYHSWSSNSRWVVFSSRRMDGLYTRPFIAHVGEDGSFSKPFALPQQSPTYYADQMQSYNIPEFVRGQITVGSYNLAMRIKEGKTQKVSFAGGKTAN